MEHKRKSPSKGYFYNVGCNPLIDDQVNFALKITDPKNHLLINTVMNLWCQCIIYEYDALSYDVKYIRNCGDCRKKKS